MSDNTDAWRRPLAGQLGLLDDTDLVPATDDTNELTAISHHQHAHPCSHRGEWPCLDCIGNWGNSTTTARS